MNQILNSKQLAHIGEETEEHLEVEDIQQTLPTPSQEKQTVNIGPYFAGAVIGFAIIAFFVVKFFRKKSA